MGISGLLPFVEDATTIVNIKQYSGKRIAVDASTWLHRGAYSCAVELIQNPAKADAYVGYAMRLAYMMRNLGTIPVLVFDGQSLPLKAAITGASRSKRRTEAKTNAQEHLARGDKDGAESAAQKAMTVTSAMCQQLIEACRQHDFEFYVSPYEADAQMAYLLRKGHVDTVVTEDSDLLVFGCKEVLFKLLPCGTAKRVKLADVFIKAGCDYAPKEGMGTHIKGLGLKKAAQLLVKFRTPESVIDFWTGTKPKDVPHNYKASFEKAERTFTHQICYCPSARRMVPLLPYPDDLTTADIPYAGEVADDMVAERLADGELDPKTLEEIEPMPFSMKTIRKLNDLAGGGNGRYKRYGGGGGGSRRQGYGSQSWTDNTPGGPKRSTAKSKRKLESSSPGILQFFSKGGLPPRKKQPKPKKLDREDSFLQSLQEDAAGEAAASGGGSGGGGEAASASAASAGEITSQGGSSSINPFKRHRGIVTRKGGTSGSSALLFGSTVSRKTIHPTYNKQITGGGGGGGVGEGKAKGGMGSPSASSASVVHHLAATPTSVCTSPRHKRNHQRRITRSQQRAASSQDGQQEELDGGGGGGSSVAIAAMSPRKASKQPRVASPPSPLPSQFSDDNGGTAHTAGAVGAAEVDEEEEDYFSGDELFGSDPNSGSTSTGNSDRATIHTADGNGDSDDNSNGSAAAAAAMAEITNAKYDDDIDFEGYCGSDNDGDTDDDDRAFELGGGGGLQNTPPLNRSESDSFEEDSQQIPSAQPTPSVTSQQSRYSYESQRFPSSPLHRSPSPSDSLTQQPQSQKHASKRDAIQDWLTRNGEAHAVESDSEPHEIFPPATARRSSPRGKGSSSSGGRRASPRKQKQLLGTSTTHRGSAAPPANAFAALMGSKARGRQGPLKKKAGAGAKKKLASKKNK